MTDPAAATQNTIPAASSLEGGGGIDAILQQNKDSLAQISALSKAAATPIPGGHSGQLPLSMQQGPKGFTPAPLDMRQMVGKGNAKAQGIGNAITGVMNAITGVTIAEQNKKKLQVASATHNLLTAQNSYDQAQTLLQTDPQNQAAKDQMKRAKDTMDGILADKKIRDAVKKGYNIDFTDPSANQTDEHKGVQQGQDMAKKSLSYAEQFNQKTPQTMQPNLQAQAQLAAAQSQQKINAEMMRAVVPMLAAQVRAGGELDRTKLQQMHADARTMATNTTKFRTTQATIQAMALRTKDAHLNRLSEIAAQGNRQLDVFKEELKMKDTDPTLIGQKSDQFKRESTKNLADTTKIISDLESERTEMASKGADAGAVSNIDNQINIAKQLQKEYQDSVNATNDFYSHAMQSMSKGGDSSAGGAANTRGRTASSADDIGEDELNPENYLDDEP